MTRRIASFAETLRRTIKELRPDYTQTQLGQSDLQMSMFIQTETHFGVETLGIVGGKLRVVEFRRVLHEEHHRVLEHPPLYSRTAT